jgi:hypothetical protein
MFDQVKTDPSIVEEQVIEDSIVVSDYITYEKNNVIKTEALYCNKHG